MNLCFTIPGVMVILALQFFTQYFEFIPKAALAAVIISAILFMVEYNVVKPMWRAKSESPFLNFL